MIINLHTDGGSRGGFGACGWIITDNKSHCWAWEGKFLGEATCNEAEYWGLIEGIRGAKKMNLNSCKIFTDSTLLVNQVTGKWRVKKEHLQKLLDIVLFELESLDYWELNWIPREKNTEADFIVDYTFKEG